MNALAGMALLSMALPAAAIESACETDQVFEQQGWVIHAPDEFDNILQSALQRIRIGTDLGPASSSPVYNLELDKIIVRIAFDQVSTPTETMIDDLVLYADEQTQTVYEVRWFDGQLKHIAYATLTCANSPIPWAENSMW